MIFNSCGKPLNSYSFRYGANKLEKVKSCKYLGLILSPYGNFHLARQMTGIEKCSLNALNKLRKEMGGHFRGNIKLTTKLFVTLIFPILRYGSEIWGIDCNGKMNKLRSRRTSAEQILKMAPGVNKYCNTNACRAEKRI